MTVLITRDELQAAIANGEVTLVDALPASYFEQQHLPGAVNLYVEEAAARAAEVLPDKSACDRHLLLERVLPEQRGRGAARSPAWGTPTSGSTARASRTGSRRGCRRSPALAPWPESHQRHHGRGSAGDSHRPWRRARHEHMRVSGDFLPARPEASGRIHRGADS